MLPAPVSLALTAILLLGSATAHRTAARPVILAADDLPTQDSAVALFKEGKREEALQAFERIIASHPPDPTPALFGATTAALELDKWRVARPYARQLVKLRPGSMQGWELMVQVDQAADDKADLKQAMDRLYSAWRSALDPAIRGRVAFVRDRIFGPKHTLVVQQTLEPGGDTIVRWIMQPLDEIGHATHYLLVGSDADTNERWRETNAVPFGTNVFHLDAIRMTPDGRTVQTPYKFFVEEPTYEQVRALAVAILNGEAKPLSGEADPFWTSDSP